MIDFESKYTGEEVEAKLDAIDGKQDAIEDLDAIRAGAAAGATALQSVPADYVTESELEDKGYATTAQLNDKQDKITDLDAIREGASKGATALQEEQYKGTVTGVTFYGKDYTPDSDGKVYMGYPDVGAVKEITINGNTKTPADGAVDLGTFLTQHQDISNKADLYNGKIITSQLPDYILGQVMYGGVIQSGNANSIVVQPSANYKAKYSLEGITVTIGKYQFWSQQGVYFISGANGTFLDLEVKVGDWLISTGSSVAKVDNTDAVSSVAGLTGVIDASALGKELSYNDLKDKPTIPSAVTESTVSGWGFTKNTGTYSKPSGGIPKTDLASTVQTSLGKADTAVQPDAISEFVTVEDLAAVATSGSYNDLTDQPDFVTKETIGMLVAAHANALYDGNNVYALPASANGDEDDVLVSKRNLKTFNGQSLFGEGDITISGGGSSSGKEYVEAPLMTEPTGTSIMFTNSVPLEPNKVYVAKKKVSAINAGAISIPSDSIGAEYTIMFQTSTSELNITFYSNALLLWANGAIPTIEADTYYELSLVLNKINNTAILKAVLTPFKLVE